MDRLHRDFFPAVQLKTWVDDVPQTAVGREEDTFEVSAKASEVFVAGVAPYVLQQKQQTNKNKLPLKTES